MKYILLLLLLVNTSCFCQKISLPDSKDSVNLYDTTIISRTIYNGKIGKIQEIKILDIQIASIGEVGLDYAVIKLDEKGNILPHKIEWKKEIIYDHFSYLTINKKPIPKYWKFITIQDY